MDIGRIHLLGGEGLPKNKQKNKGRGVGVEEENPEVFVHNKIVELIRIKNCICNHTSVYRISITNPCKVTVAEFSI